MTKEEKIEVFKRELSYISDDNLKKFAIKIIENSDDYFYNVPASSSGKYHPDFARGNGGLLRHTRAVAYFTNEICRAELEFKSITEKERDMLIIAAISHDIKKQGDGSGNHTVKDHPYLGAEYVKKIYEENTDLLSEKEMLYIYNAIRSHMGPWCDIKPETRSELIVFYADYIASRKEIEGLDFISKNGTASVEPEIQKPTPKMTVDEYVFDFGKTVGLTIKESYEKEPGYIKWMANKEGFGKADVQLLVQEFLKNK